MTITPKEKAKKLISINLLITLSELGRRLTMDEGKEIAKQCALITVDEVLGTLYDYHYDSGSGAYEYWTEVNQELQKL